MKKLLSILLISASLLSCGKAKDFLENKFESKNQESVVNQNLKTGYVIKVYDGDTVTLEDKTRLRLYGIDAPELKQKGGKFSQENLYNKIYNKKIQYEVISTDRYGRNVAKIYYKGEYINKYMLESGSAWWYEEYSKNDKDLETAFETAKKNRVGIFKDYNIKNPSEYRREMKAIRNKN
jgi:Micrococcal nuclease (thermonuclease) homologs